MDISSDPKWRELVWNDMPIRFHLGIQAQGPDDDAWHCQKSDFCENCDLPCVMWMCDDATWDKLPAVLHDKWLCLDCFAWFHHGRKSSNANSGPCLLQSLVDTAATTATKS
jgi:hypothetical protein